MNKKKFLVSLFSVLILLGCGTQQPVPVENLVAKSTSTATRIVRTTATPIRITTVTPRTSTSISNTTVANTNSPNIPYSNAPICPSHDNTVWHDLWDSARGCHYDHEHGKSPFTQEASDTFPNFDLISLLGGVEIGNTNPSSSMENTHKHGGFKWEVMLANPHGCVGGFENATYCVSAALIQYHNFGDYSMEMEARIHSTTAMLKVCNPSNTSDCGYMYSVQHSDFGQRVTPYQGTIIPYPNNPSPSYGSGFGQYFTIDCVGTGLTGCRTSLNQIRTSNLNTNSIWTSKPTGSGTRPDGSTILRILFRVRDTYQVFNSADLEYPFNFPYICSNDNGETYNPVNCRWNNSTSNVHEVAGTIPASWDNLSGFDSNPAVGRITAQGFTNRYGVLDLLCTQADANCFPIKMINMFVGKYGDYLTASKVSNTTAISNPERDIYFCNGVLCSESSSGATPSGWIGNGN